MYPGDNPHPDFVQQRLQVADGATARAMHLDLTLAPYHPEHHRVTALTLHYLQCLALMIIVCLGHAHAGELDDHDRAFCMDIHATGGVTVSPNGPAPFKLKLAGLEPMGEDTPKVLQDIIDAVDCLEVLYLGESDTGNHYVRLRRRNFDIGFAMLLKKAAKFDPVTAQWLPPMWQGIYQNTN